MSFFLKILNGVEPGQVGNLFALQEGDNFLGRVSPPCQLVLEGKKVSKRHCVFSVKGQTAMVEDLHSSNGIFLNGRRVQNSKLKAGDRLVVGEYLLELVVK